MNRGRLAAEHMRWASGRPPDLDEDNFEAPRKMEGGCKWVGFSTTHRKKVGADGKVTWVVDP
jgi:hypothetical protein